MAQIGTPRRLSPQALLARAKRIRVIAMDIDGVLTNGDVTVRDSGEEVKPMSAKDRFGFVLARKSRSKLRFMWISGRGCPAVKSAAKNLRIDAVALKVEDKRVVYERFKRRLRVTDREVAYIGDDLIDLPVLMRVGLSFCPADAVNDVTSRVHRITKARGGQGVLREVVELILKAQGNWKPLLGMYAS